MRYSLAYVPPGAQRPAIVYDNHAGKGHHKHIGERQEQYPLRGVDELVRDFLTDVDRLRRGEERDDV